jgi:hypothetical protein
MQMTEREIRDNKARQVRILAKSIFKDLQDQGLDEKQIVALATELLSAVTNSMAKRESQPQINVQDVRTVA